ncbi:uroporphyrinogen-III C-methyltransferase [Niabella terrae]
MKQLILIGAGPGDPELITVKAIKALKKADIILYDALVNPELLEYAAADVPKIFCGKRFGCHWLSQQQINELILESAGRYETIVRLKGGDPFIFGRAQEEIETARSAGMQVEVIPGISSALAVPASQMIPLTSRGVNESFWVVTGTTRSGGVSEDLRLAAQSSATLVFLMAMNQLETITDELIRHGKSETPAAIIQNGTRQDARIVTGKVRDIALRAAHAGLENPAVIVVGEVVDLNRGLEKTQMEQISSLLQHAAAPVHTTD